MAAVGHTLCKQPVGYAHNPAGGTPAQQVRVAALAAERPGPSFRQMDRAASLASLVSWLVALKAALLQRGCEREGEQSAALTWWVGGAGEVPCYTALL